jgi:hypothetical protein
VLAIRFENSSCIYSPLSSLLSIDTYWHLTAKAVP